MSLLESPKNLFDIVPPRLFQPLTAPSQRIYAAALLNLYQRAQLEFVLQEEAAVETVINAVAEADQAEQELLGQDSGVQEELHTLEKYSGLDAVMIQETYQKQRLQARAILRYLIATGWLVTEQQPNGAYHYTFPSHTFPFFKAFREIIERRPTEFEGMIYGIYAMLRDPDAQVSGYALFQQVHSQTQQIIDGLKQLQDNIKGYLDQLISDVEVNEILRNFAKYQGMITPAYHRLKTADHVSRYRHDIQQRISDYIRDTQWVGRVAQEMERRQPQISLAEAERIIYDQLEYIETQFDKLDNYIKKIDERHGRYADNLVSQIKYRVQGRQDLKGQLVSLLEGWREYAPRSAEPLAPLFSLFEVDYVDRDSLRKPSKEQKSYQPDALPQQFEAVDLESLQEKLAHRMEQLITPAKVWAYLAPHLEGQAQVKSNQLPLETVEDWLMLIGLRVYANIPHSPYRCLEPPPDQPWVEQGPFRCYNLQFEKA